MPTVRQAASIRSRHASRAPHGPHLCLPLFFPWSPPSRGPAASVGLLPPFGTAEPRCCPLKAQSIVAVYWILLISICVAMHCVIIVPPHSRCCIRWQTSQQKQAHASSLQSDTWSCRHRTRWYSAVHAAGHPMHVTLFNHLPPPRGARRTVRSLRTSGDCFPLSFGRSGRSESGGRSPRAPPATPPR